MLASTWGRSRRCTGVLVGIALVVLGVVVDVRNVRASCVAPILSLDHSSGAAGDIVEIRGQYFGTACNDVQVDGTFAGPPLGEPQTSIELVIVQADQVIPLGLIDADKNYEFGVRLAIPTQLSIGPTTIRVDPPPRASSVASASFTVTSVSANIGTASTTTELLTSTIIDSSASTLPAPTSNVVLGSTSGFSSSPSDADSNRLAPWVWGLIGLGLLATLAVVAGSRVRTRRRTT